MKHTPTPWRVTERSGGPSGYDVMCGTIRMAASQREREAAHIVKCVNAHDELVAALREIAMDSTDENARDIARAALAKVQQ